MKAVEEQMRMVSIKTESICTRPCLAGWETSAEAAAFGAEPMPGFIGIQTALDAVHHCRTKKTAENGFRAEGFAEDADKDEGQSLNMQEHNNDCCKNINTCHDGDEHLCYLRDALAARPE